MSDSGEKENNKLNKNDLIEQFKKYKEVERHSSEK